MKPLINYYSPVNIFLLLLFLSCSACAQVKSDTMIIDGTHIRGIVSKAISNGEYDGSDNGSNELVVDTILMDEDEAEEARKYFGVF